MIDIRNLERSYKTGAGQTWVLRRIDLKIERGEFVTLMGPSGAGKSSLLNAIALLDDQWLGEYYFDGDPVHAMSRKQRAELAKRSMGMVFQSYHLLDELTVAENIDLPLSYKNMPRAERQALVADTLDRFNIVGTKDLFLSQLSGRQQQPRAAAGREAHRQPALRAGQGDHGAFQGAQPAGNHHPAGHPFGDQRRLRQPAARSPGWL